MANGAQFKSSGGASRLEVQGLRFRVLWFRVEERLQKDVRAPCDYSGCVLAVLPTVGFRGLSIYG